MCSFNIFLNHVPPQLCQAKGFVCEFCNNDKDIIFPFQLNKCQRCEGEPSPLGSGLHNLKAPSTRPFIPLTWKEWKISNPRRLAKALSEDRREGEGGEEDLDVPPYEGEIGREQQSKETGEEKKEGVGIFPTFPSVELVKVFSRGKDNEEEQEVSGEMESEQEGGEEGKENERVNKNGRATGKPSVRRGSNARRESVNLLRVLQLERLKVSMLMGDRSSDSETGSSLEALDEVGQKNTREQKKVLGLLSRPKNFLKNVVKWEEKTEVKVEEAEKTTPEQQSETEKAEETEEGDENQSEGGSEAAEAEQSESATDKEGFSVSKLLKPHQLSSIFSRGKLKGGDEGGDKTEGNRDGTAERGVHEASAFVTRTNWRGRKTRKAVRKSRGRKTREGSTENSEGGEGSDSDDGSEGEERKE